MKRAYLAVILVFSFISITYGQDPSLVGWWKFDDGTGTTAADSSGKGHDGTIEGNVTWTQGRLGQALSFGGNEGNYVDLGTWNPSEGTGQLTVALWLNWSGSGTTWQGAIGKRDLWNRNLMMWQVELATNSNPPGFLTFAQEGSYSGIGFTLPSGQWVHVAVTFDGTNSTLYRDGQPIGTAPFSFGLDTTAAMMIGASEAGGVNPWKGAIDDVQIYNRALSAAEVAGMCALYGGGHGTSEDPYQIWTPGQMNTIGLNPSDWGKSFKLMADIDMSAYTGNQYNIIGQRNGAGAFTGTFDGNRHILSNLTISIYPENYVGLFGYIGSGGKVVDLGLENVNISGGGDVGGLAGRNYYGSLTACYATGTISGADSVGGLVGVNYGTIMDCYTTDTVNGAAYGGGLVGYNIGVLSACYATGKVSGHTWVGGLVGENTGGTLADCYATGAVSGTDSVGGLAGLNDYGTFTACYAAGAVWGTHSVGGLVGDHEEGTNAYTACFWDLETTGMTDGIGILNPGPVGVDGKTTAEMKTLSTFTSSDWDFANQWAICEGTNYPRLKWQILTTDWVCPDGVGVEDLLYLAKRWLAHTPETIGTADLSGDAKVDLADFALFAEQWMK